MTVTITPAAAATATAFAEKMLKVAFTQIREKNPSLTDEEVTELAKAYVLNLVATKKPHLLEVVAAFI